MKYYSRPPSEIRRRLREKYFQSIPKKRLSRLILFIDLLLVVLIGLYFQDRMKQNKTQNIKKEFEFSGLKILSACKEKIGCHIDIQSTTKKKVEIQKIKWSVRTNKNEIEKKIYEVSTNPKKGKQNKPIGDTFSFPLSSEQIVYVNLLLTHSQENTKFQIFP